VGVRKWARGLGLAQHADIQAEFTVRVGTILRALDRVPVGWDEVLHPRLSRDKSMNF
jgi:tryptophanyl-tRNA synthetase